MPQLHPAIVRRLRRSQGEARTHLPQKLAPIFDIREGAGHEVPEFGGVGLYGQVSQLMDDDVLDDLGREHHGAPAESEGAVGGAASPAAALAPNEHPRPLAHAESGPPEVYPRSNVFGGLRTVPHCEGVQDAFPAHIFFESGAHGDLKLTLVEADLGRRSSSVLDDHLDIATDVGESLACDEAPGERLFRQVGHPFDDPRGAVEHDVPNLGVGCSGGGGHEDSLGGQPDLDGLLAPRASAYVVGDGGAVEGNLASSPRGESSVISLVAWRLLQFTEDYKALAMSGLLASPEKRTTPSFSARGATPSIAPLHEVPRMILIPSTLVRLL